MTRISKLYSRFESGGPISFNEFIRLIEAFGFTHRRTTGSHRIYARDDLAEQLNIQPKGKDIKPYQRARDDLAEQLNIQPKGKDIKPYQRKQFHDIVAKYDLRMDDEA